MIIENLEIMLLNIKPGCQASHKTIDLDSTELMFTINVLYKILSLICTGYHRASMGYYYHQLDQPNN